MSELSICQALEQYKKIVQPIKGISMLPMLEAGKDAVELVAVTGQLKTYDLVLFQRPNGQLVLHRIIAVKKNHYWICGDNSLTVEKVPRSRILAVASGYFKDGQYISCQDEAYCAYVLDRWTNFSAAKLIKTTQEESLHSVEKRTRNGVKKKGLIKYIGSRIFIPYRQMCMEYPFLWKLPILLPVFWVVRLAGALFDGKKRKKLNVELKTMTNKKNG